MERAWGDVERSVKLYSCMSIRLRPPPCDTVLYSIKYYYRNRGHTTRCSGPPQTGSQTPRPPGFHPNRSVSFRTFVGERHLQVGAAN